MHPQIQTLTSALDLLGKESHGAENLVKLMINIIIIIIPFLS